MKTRIVAAWNDTIIGWFNQHETVVVPTFGQWRVERYDTDDRFGEPQTLNSTCEVLDGVWTAWEAA